MAPHASAFQVGGLNASDFTTDEADNYTCSPFPNEPNRCEELAKVRLAVSVLSLFSAILVLVLILGLQRYKSLPAQRLIFWLTLSAALMALTGCFFNARTSSKSTSCQLQAFLFQLALWGVIFWLASITFNVSWTVLGSMRKAKAVAFEKAYHVLCWSLSSVMALIPLAFDGYGNVGDMCWISGSHKRLRFAAFYGPFYVVMTCILIAYVLIMRKFIRSSKRLEQRRSADTQMGRWRVARGLFAYPLLFLALALCPFIRRLYQVVHGENTSPYSLAVLHTISSQLVGFVIFLNYVLDKGTFSAIRASNIAGVLSSCPSRLRCFSKFLSLGDRSGEGSGGSGVSIMQGSKDLSSSTKVLEEHFLSTPINKDTATMEITYEGFS